MTRPRFFVLTASATPDDAIDFVEARGHRVIATALTGACAVPVYGICEVEGPGDAGEPAGGAA